MSNIVSDDDHDSSDDGDESDRQLYSRQSQYSQADKRAHHNALERKRRDHIKDSFTDLRDAVPYLQKEKASRAQILKKAAEYIVNMRKKNEAHKLKIQDLSNQNKELERQIHVLENMERDRGYRPNLTLLNNKDEATHTNTISDSDSSESIPPAKRKRMKKVKRA